MRDPRLHDHFELAEMFAFFGKNTPKIREGCAFRPDGQFRWTSRPPARNPFHENIADAKREIPIVHELGMDR